MKDRRKDERRNWALKQRFPLVDRHGQLVTHTRRRTVERRSNDSAESGGQESIPTLRLKLNGLVKDLEADSHTTITIGRSKDCDMVSRSRFASRNHARFEYLEDHFVVIDTSQNGTYVETPNGDWSQAKASSIILTPGRGRISLGQPIDSSAEPDIDYEILHAE